MEEEIKRLTNVRTTERKAARAFLDQTKFDIFNYVKSEEMIDQSVLMPEFFAPFPVNKAYVDVEIQFTPNKMKREAEVRHQNHTIHLTTQQYMIIAVK